MFKVLHICNVTIIYSFHVLFYNYSVQFGLLAALILFIQTLALYKSFTYLLTYLLTYFFNFVFILKTNRAAVVQSGFYWHTVYMI